MVRSIRLETIAVNETQLKLIHAQAVRRAKRAKAPLKLYFRRIKGHVPSTTATGTSCKNHSLIEVPPDIRRHVIKHKSKGRVKLKGALGRAHSRGVACYADAAADVEHFLNANMEPPQKRRRLDLRIRIPGSVPTPTLQTPRSHYAPYAVEGNNPGLGSEAADAAYAARNRDITNRVSPPPGYYSRRGRMNRIFVLRFARNELRPRVYAAGRTRRGNVNLAIQLMDIESELERELSDFNATAPFIPDQVNTGMMFP
jgi:hypothetical protein